MIEVSENLQVESIPKYGDLLLPLLKAYSDGKPHTLKDLLPKIAREFELSESQLQVMQGSGRQSLFKNRLGWAQTYLTKALLLRKTERAVYVISERGRELLAKSPVRITPKDLLEYPEFLEFMNRSSVISSTIRAEPTELSESSLTPEDLIDRSVVSWNSVLTSNLLDAVKNSSPAFFEELVVALLAKMGYGCFVNGAAQVTGRSGDEGIDGYIKEDKLGLDTIYVQAKRWRNTPIGRPELQKFVGALQGKKSKKGVFLTTSRFSADAINYVDNIGMSIALIDGERLAQLMIDYGVGVVDYKVVSLKKLDDEFFDS